MRVIARRTLREFWEKHPDAEQALQTWYSNVRHANWQTPDDIKRLFRSASFVARNRVVFNIKGNRYRLVVVVVYEFSIVYVRFIGTHQEYDAIDVTTI